MSGHRGQGGHPLTLKKILINLRTILGIFGYFGMRGVSTYFFIAWTGGSNKMFLNLSYYSFSSKDRSFSCVKSMLKMIQNKKIKNFIGMEACPVCPPCPV
ncbi:MAG TPA: hypothetical protein VLA74_10810 [Nitrososphaeraceae archaeon]|nr:hypothetical protein [Nitrososphaeraceae archaeon]